MQQEPGQMIIPGGDGQTGPQLPTTGAPQPERPAEQPESVNPPSEPTTPPPILPEQNQPFNPVPQQPVASQDFSQAAQPQPFSPIANDDWQNPDQTNTPAALLPEEDISWQAAEFIEHQKSAGWYGLLIIATIVLCGLDYLLTKDFISMGVIAFAAIMFGVYAGHKPRTQQYRLSTDGLYVGQRLFGYHDFKNFTVSEEAGVASVNFTPLRRFMPPITIYVAPDLEERVLDYLSAFLPFDAHKTDVVDNILRRIHF